MIVVEFTSAGGALALFFEILDQQHDLAARRRSFDRVGDTHDMAGPGDVLVHANVPGCAGLLRHRS